MFIGTSISTYVVDHAPFQDAVLNLESAIEAIVVEPLVIANDPAPFEELDFIDKTKPVIIYKEKNSDEEECRRIAEQVGVGAVVFYYLSNNRMRDINFMMEDALSFDGNTGPYAQYTYARTCSILDKAKEMGIEAEMGASELTDEENELVKVLSTFPERVAQAIADYEPSVVTRYALDLCAAFNRFYHDCKIINSADAEERKTRLALTKATKTVLGTALRLICIATPEKI